MSDKQPENEPSGDREYTGGWTRPTKAGGWQVPDEKTRPQTGGWRRVRAMPSDLETTPSTEGVWHLPKPEDTPFTPEDEIQITQAAAAVRPEDMMFADAQAEAEEEDTAEAVEEEVLEELVEDLEAYSGLGELVATLSAV